MANLIQLEQQLLAHDLQRAHLSRVLLLGQVDLAVSTLTDLCENLEIAMSQLCSPLSQIGPLASEILGHERVVFVFGCLWRLGHARLELLCAALTLVHVAEEVEIVVEEV